MQSIFEHTQNNILVIPQGLFGMKDISVLMQHRNSAIFFKQLTQDLVDVEFYTNLPCFIYIASGEEVLTTSNANILELRAGSAIFLPQGLNLHSDFVRKTRSLKAFLVFFDDQIITEFLSSKRTKDEGAVSNDSYCLLQNNQNLFKDFFHSLRPEIGDNAYLKVKLTELLYLIDWKDEKGSFLPLLTSMCKLTPKKNLSRLLSNHDHIHLSVNELAELSGRSLSTFNRDFKETYQITPKKWLQDKRLNLAKELIFEKDVTVTEAAAEVGYENISNFIKAFKSKFGVTPKQIKHQK